MDGDKIVTIHGEQINVKADIRHIEAYSSHADQAGLMGWLKKFTTPPRRVFLVHGEGNAQQVLADLIQKELHLVVVIPQWLDEYQLDSDEAMQAKAIYIQPEIAVSNNALEAEALYLQLRTKLNLLYQDSISSSNFVELIDKLKKVSADL